jgi:hypothetical protein
MKSRADFAPDQGAHNDGIACRTFFGWHMPCTPTISLSRASNMLLSLPVL